MHSQWTWKGSHQDEEIEDLLQELARLKLRLSKIERRENLRSLGRDCNGVRGKYAATMASRSFVPTKSLVTDDDDEGIADDQISSTPPSIEFSFKGFEDSLSKSSFVPLYDEPMYDVYDDDMISGVLDLKQLAYDFNDDSKLEGPHNINDDQLKLEKGLLSKVMLENNQCSLLDNGVEIHDWIGRVTELEERKDACKAAKELISNESWPKATRISHMIQGYEVHSFRFNFEAWPLGKSIKISGEKKEKKKNKTLKFINNFHRLQSILKSLLDEANDTRWKYLDRFSQPNPPPSCGQPDIFL
ncbi:Villin-3 [Dendrobium catenatum]|uniref:Villin-3 n=1 Tax=Dendrobium catenatum TaxID=906689 RepID=A0A2I0VPJ6_9ASPA|nr:Villin-3 [Dendrobium catenatum]